MPSSSILKTESADFTENLVNIYQNMRRHVPRDSNRSPPEYRSEALLLVWMGLRAGRPGLYSRQGKIILYSTASRPALGLTQPLIQWVQGEISPRMKRQEREADNSPPSSTEAKKGGDIPPLPPMSSWHRDNFNTLAGVGKNSSEV
jgi:hypothetical protein